MTKIRCAAWCPDRETHRMHVAMKRKRRRFERKVAKLIQSKTVESYAEGAALIIRRSK